MKNTIKVFMVLLALFSGKEAIMAQEIISRNNGASQNSVVIIRSDNASGDQTGNQTSDLDFQIWDSNTRLNIPQGRIGMVGDPIASQPKEASGRMAFYTTNEAYPSPSLTERMRIDQNGNIGIGLTNPKGKLEIQGLKGEQQQGQIHILGNGQAGPGDAYISFFEGSEANSKWSVGVKDNDNAFSISHGLTMDASPKLIITDVTGNVGIGTTKPGAWKLAVNGNIRAKEIKVETGWADFVFKDDYNLPTLKEVENHIKEKGHLKDIPNANEVAENGILLGEMNSKLLQKIEELTLYTIQQEKEIQNLKKENTVLQNLVNRVIKLEETIKTKK